MRYFDFHTHVVFKQIFDESPNLNNKISRNDVGGIPRACTDMPNIIATQIHPSQLAEYHEEVIVGAVLYGLESYMANQVGPLRKFLKPDSRHKLSETLLSDVGQMAYPCFSNFTVSKIFDNYLAATETFHVLDKASFDQPLPKNTVNIFFVVEGCHSLVDSHNRYTPPGHFFPVDEILRNLDTLLARAKILTVNLTHLQPSNLCNHAHGIQLTGIEPFIPQGNGLAEDGKRVTQGLFDRGVCVDVKHMSFLSRHDLMQGIDAGTFNNVQPLCCTHTGFTGVSFQDWPDYISIKKVALGAVYLELAKPIQVENEPVQPGAPAFNLSTINLFNEEIVWIVRHGGVIGLSMDRRILGYVDPFDEDVTGIRGEGAELVVDKEFISKDEWMRMGISDNRLPKEISTDNCVTVDSLDDNTGRSNGQRDEYFMDHILLHLKHYLQVCIDADIPLATAQQHLCIGSDFDGLINPFLNLDTVEAMADLKKYILMNFSIYLHSLKDSKLWADQLDIQVFVENLFYENGFRFVKSRF